jgi:hypothetical protein
MGYAPLITRVVERHADLNAGLIVRALELAP